jgi:phosphatidate cytidylyltransferase
MTSALRALTATQQVGLLFVIVFGLLLIAAIGMFVWSIKIDEGSPAAEEHDRLSGILRTSWVMAAVFWVGWALGDVVATIMFAFVSLFVLREFVSLSPTKRGDHRALIGAFFMVLPIQYALVIGEHFNLFTVFIPVYAFLALPVISAIGGDPQRFLERNAKLQWGVMVCVYGMSHVPALMLLPFPGYEGRGAFLVFFLVVVVQGCMIMQHFIARAVRKVTPVAPQISQSFHWRSWGYSIFFGAVLGGLLSGITPLKAGQAFVMSLLACIAGTMGHFVMKALKRDRGVRNWGGYSGVTGASGLLDRMDSLCFAAPIFFHSVRWYFQL